MKWSKQILAITLISLTFMASLWPLHAFAADPPQLVIAGFKITSSNGQFFSLYNTTDQTLDMAKYQLQYFNNYDVSKATSSRQISLSGTLAPHSYYIVSDSTQVLCYRATVNSLSLGLSSTAGLVEVLGFTQTNPGGPLSPSLQDYVTWSKTAATGAQTLPTSTNAFLLRQPVDQLGNPPAQSAGSGTWQAVQPDPTNACNVVTVSANKPITVDQSLLLPAVEPAVTIISVEDNSVSATNAGLMAPLITEILPNPLGTGNDATDEFIELYNPNNVAFDLSGFSLEAGTTITHSFYLPSGTSLSPKSFTIFYASDTGLSLSNTAGQVRLLNPAGTPITSTDEYETAKDGQAWALANGSWYWTVVATPGTNNIISQPQPTKSKGTSKKSSTKGSVKGVSTTKPVVSSSGTTVSKTVAAKASPSTPIHPWVLALVASLALLYGAYEYRADIANRVYKFRRNLTVGRRHRR
jgi:hypothetical protein